MNRQDKKPSYGRYYMRAETRLAFGWRVYLELRGVFGCRVNQNMMETDKSQAIN